MTSFKEERAKAAIYEDVIRIKNEAAKIAEMAVQAADKDEQIQELRSERDVLKMELQKTKAERNQALERERYQTNRADRAENYIERQGMSAGYEHEIQKEEHVRHRVR